MINFSELPQDITEEEVKILAYSSIQLYQLLDDPVDKFIVAMVFDLGYGREETARALGFHYHTVYQRIKKIQDKLAELYNIKV
jgi:DNA invertase Pin-like site-specific DNA recombinase